MKLLAVNAADDATLTELQTTNLLLWVRAYDDAAWSATGAVVNPTPTPPSPDGYGNVCDLLYEDTSTGLHQLDQGTASAVAVGTYTASIYLAPGGRTLAYLFVHNLAAQSNSVQLGVNLDTGDITTTLNGTGFTVVRSSVSNAMAGGFRRVSVTFTISSSISLLFRVRLRNGTGATNYTGDGASGVYLVDAQLEPTPVETVTILNTDTYRLNARWLTTLPHTNLQLEGRSLVGRSNGSNAGNLGVIVTFPGVRVIDAAVLYRHNLTDLGRLRIVLFSGPDLSGDVLYDSGNEESSPASWGSYGWVTDQLAPRFSVIWLPAAVSAQSALVLLRDTGSAYIQVKRLLLGQAITPSRQVTTGMGLEWVDNSQQQRTLAGSLRTDPQARYRRLTGELDALPESERAALLEAAGYAGLSREIFVSVFPGAGGTQERDHALLGKFTRLPQLQQAKPLWARSTFEISEV